MTAPLNNDQTPEGTDQDQTPPAGGDNDQDQDKPLSRQDRRDAQARERAAELETERDALAARLDARDRAEVARLAGEILAQGSDLLDLGGVSLDDLRDENGDINADEVAAMAAALVDQRPGLSVNAEIKRGHKDWGHTRTRDNDMYAPGGTGAPSWSAAFGAAGRENGMRYT